MPIKKSILGLVAIMFFGCASAPETRPDQRALEAQAEAAVARMTQRDESLSELLARAPGYAVFPRITTAAAIVGGASGVGVVYRRGRVLGYAELMNISVGAQLGGQAHTQLIVFENEAALERLIAGNFDIEASASATALNSGAAAEARFEGGTAVFIDDESGLLASAAVGGEQISFHAK